MTYSLLEYANLINDLFDTRMHVKKRYTISNYVYLEDLGYQRCSYLNVAERSVVVLIRDLEYYMECANLCRFNEIPSAIYAAHEMVTAVESNNDFLSIRTPAFYEC